jgi:hypothetical protein
MRNRFRRENGFNNEYDPRERKSGAFLERENLIYRERAWWGGI